MRSRPFSDVLRRNSGELGLDFLCSLTFTHDQHSRRLSALTCPQDSGEWGGSRQCWDVTYLFFCVGSYHHKHSRVFYVYGPHPFFSLCFSVLHLSRVKSFINPPLGRVESSEGFPAVFSHQILQTFCGLRARWRKSAESPEALTRTFALTRPRPPEKLRRISGVQCTSESIKGYFNDLVSPSLASMLLSAAGLM